MKIEIKTIHHGTQFESLFAEALNDGWEAYQVGFTYTPNGSAVFWAIMRRYRKQAPATTREPDLR
jgi:hypothetical protein